VIVWLFLIRPSWLDIRFNICGLLTFIYLYWFSKLLPFYYTIVIDRLMLGRTKRLFPLTYDLLKAISILIYLFKLKSLFKANYSTNLMASLYFINLFINSFRKFKVKMPFIILLYIIWNIFLTLYYYVLLTYPPIYFYGKFRLYYLFSQTFAFPS